jgi:hypothetical protein
MRNLAATADRIDHWIRRRIVPCAPPSNVNPALDSYIALAAIARSLRDQYDALAAPLPPNLAALVKRLEAQSTPSRDRGIRQELAAGMTQ